MARDPRPVSDGTLSSASLASSAPAKRRALDSLIATVLANGYHLSASEVIKIARSGKRHTSGVARKAQAGDGQA